MHAKRWPTYVLVVVLLAAGSVVARHIYWYRKDSQMIRVLEQAGGVPGGWGATFRAARYLGDRKVARAAPALVSVMRNESGLGVSGFAATALARIGTPEAVDALIAELEQGSAVAETAAWGLFLAGDERAVPSLLRALESNDYGLRHMAAVALTKFGRKEGIPALVDVLCQYDLQIIEEAKDIESSLLRQLGGIPHPQDMEILIFVSEVVPVIEEMAGYCASQLRELTRESFGYDSSTTEEGREAAIQAWRDWLKTNYPEEAPEGN